MPLTPPARPVSLLRRLARGLVRGLKLVFLVLVVLIPAPLATLIINLVKPARRNLPAQVVRRQDEVDGGPPTPGPRPQP